MYEMQYPTQCMEWSQSGSGMCPPKVKTWSCLIHCTYYSCVCGGLFSSPWQRAPPAGPPGEAPPPQRAVAVRAARLQDAQRRLQHFCHLLAPIPAAHRVRNTVKPVTGRSYEAEICAILLRSPFRWYISLFAEFEISRFWPKILDYSPWF